MKETKNNLVPSRLARRANYDEATINAILDEALYCTISFSKDDKPFAIPTAFVRIDDQIYIHGSVGSHFIMELEKGLPVCIVVSLIDALVVAKSAFHHSVNYRSVVIFANAEKVTDPELKANAFTDLTNKMVPGSWDYLRPMKDSEVRKTTALRFSLASASAKVRSGMPVDDEEDQQLPIWSGLIPLRKGKEIPIADDLSKDIPLPPHLKF